MTDIQKLREELAKAEAIEEKNKKLQELERYSKYSGIYRHVSFSRGKKRKMEGISFIRLSNFARDRHDRIVYRSESINCSDFSSAHGYTKNGIEYIIQQETIYDSYPSFMIWNCSDISNAKFDELIKIVKGRAATFLNLLENLEEITIHENTPKNDFLLDLSFIQFEPHESILFRDSDFMLPGYRYLITSNSIKAAFEDLDRQHSDLYRGSHRFEACDMGYVRNKESSMSSARRKLIEASKK